MANIAAAGPARKLPVLPAPLRAAADRACRRLPWSTAYLGFAGPGALWLMPSGDDEVPELLRQAREAGYREVVVVDPSGNGWATRVRPVEGPDDTLPPEPDPWLLEWEGAAGFHLVHPAEGRELHLLADAARDPRVPEVERLAALRELIGTRFRKPIAPKRWRALAGAIDAALAELAADGCTERDFVTAALAEALPEVPGEAWSAAAEGRPDLLRDAIGSCLSRVATERLLGADWRNRPAHVDLSDSVPGPSSPETILASKEQARAAWRRYRAVLGKVHPGDRSIYIGLRRLVRDGTPLPAAKRQVARERGVSVNAVDKAISRIRAVASG